MVNLDFLIEYEEESTNLDFKKSEYVKKEYTDLIKDVMAMANASNDETKRIIIGVKHKPGEERELLGIETLTDQATLENVIQENIEPTVNFKYYDYCFNGKKYGILEISNNYDKPYAMRKDYNGLHKGEIWIRKGTRQSRATRTDILELVGAGSQHRFKNRIKIGFGNTLNKTIKIGITDIDKDELPSSLERKRLQALLSKLEDRFYSKKEEKPSAATSLIGKIGLAAIAGLNQEFNEEDKSIRVGSNQFGMPVYNDRKKLLDRIANVKRDYSEDDAYFIFEKNSHKINFYILNDGTEFLEDVKIELYFDANAFAISEKKPEKPSYYNPLVKMPMPSINTSFYPDVDKQGETIIVTEYLENVRHKSPAPIFKEDLRVIVFPNSGISETIIKYTISAKNLPEPIEGTLSVNIE